MFQVLIGILTISFIIFAFIEEFEFQVLIGILTMFAPLFPEFTIS